jgi:hypothetical protein
VPDHPSTPTLDEVAALFPGWQIDDRPGGLPIVTAFWMSGDGRHRRYLVARSAAELLAALQALGT